MEDLENRGLWRTADEASQIFRQIVDFLPDATFVIDKEGRVIAWNRALERMTGVMAKDMIGKGNYEYSLAFYEQRRPVLIDLVTNPDREILARYSYVRREGETLISETEPEMLKLGDVNLLNLACPLYDRDGRVIGAIETIRDITEQKKAAKALKDSEERFRLLFYSSPDAVSLNRMEDGLYVDINEGFTNVTGFTREEVLGRSAVDINIWNDPKDIKRLLRELRGRGYCENLEAVFRKKDGTLGTGLMSARVISLDDIPHIISITHEITETKRAEERIKASEARYRSLFETANDAIFLMEGGFIIDCNRKTLEMFGCRREQIIGRSPDLFSPRLQPDGEDSRERARQKLEEVLKGHAQYFEWRHQRPDGTLFDTEVSLNRIEMEGRFFVQAIVRDISERKRAQEALARSEERYRELFQNAADPMYTVDLQGRFIECNDAFLKEGGWTAEEIIGHSFELLLHPDDIAIAGEAFEMGMRGESFNFEMRARYKDGRFGWFSFINRPIFSKDGSICAIHGMAKNITERKIAEEALVRSEERYRSLVEESFDGIFIHDGSKIVFANKRLHEMLGYGNGELVGMDHWMVYHPDLHGLAKERAKARLRGDRPISQYEVKLQRKDGSSLYGEVSAKVIGFGGKTGIQVWVKDITERRKAEDALSQSEKRFRQLYEATSDAICTQDLEGRFLSGNRAILDMFGLAQEDFIGRKASEFMKPELAPLFETEYLQRLKDTGHYHGITAYYAKDGHKFYLEYQSDLIRPSESDPFISVVARDVTHRVLSERKIREKEENIRAILEANPNPMAVYGPEGNLLYLNPAFTEVFGWTQEEMTRDKVAFVPDDQREVTAAKIKELYDTGKAGTLETRRIAKDGRVLDVSVSAALMRDNRGTPTGMVVNFMDVTERKKLEAQFQQAQKMESVGILAGGVAHDFNNMLGVILGRVELALLKMDSTSPIHSDLLDIQKAAMRSADLTRQLLAFARKQTAAPKILNLNETIAGMLKMLRRLIGEDIDLGWFPGPDIWPVKVDPAQLDQVLANLCVNARDAIQDVGKITIETENAKIDENYCKDKPYASPGRYVVIAVSDTGCGIERDLLEKIFEPFFTTKEVGKGTGLGLSTVYGIVKQNEGWINVYSEPGTGTTFKIYLPAQGDVDVEKAPRTEEEEIPKGNGTILLVEDEAMLLEMGEMMLKRLGYDVLTALGPAQALEIAESFPGKIHLLMTDVVMPEMNGMELSERISSLRPGIKCLFTSGYTANVIARHGVLKEGVNFIEKPHQLKGLAKKIRSVLE
jgi:PAS domain S-box-containing protein